MFMKAHLKQIMGREEMFYQYYTSYFHARFIIHVNLVDKSTYARIRG